MPIYGYKYSIYRGRTADCICIPENWRQPAEHGRSVDQRPHVAVLSGSAPVAAAIDRSCDGDRPHLR
jgi:hypothetical protein